MWAQVGVVQLADMFISVIVLSFKGQKLCFMVVRFGNTAK